ncbi:RluA family pseudouridine synthase [Candidatus Vallotiella sp. (ex Adelges kitamiensis)]|uniref:RluA family pseudouridine synthase n=1 Tax=Candidatus Vallotiella sp. (ex Adelges kitamiensis) TaxID=2864217 RepID=UPI001CE3A418|nr:RluA family pseudouridine synthase [Candidatus Vallotia sp. (ex Adelges kitamiensis)]
MIRLNKRFNTGACLYNTNYNLSESAERLNEQVARVPLALVGERLDKAMARLFPAFSRSRLQTWIGEGRVTLDGVQCWIRQPVHLGATVRFVPDMPPQASASAPEPMPLTILYEDNTLAVIDKPAGLVVHPAAGNWSGTLLNGLLYRYPDAAGLPRAGIVHRLDKDTSGLMVVARTLAAQVHLVRQLQAHTVKRRYIALTWGVTPPSGCISKSIGRDPRKRTRMAVLARATSKPAHTHFMTADTGIWSGHPVSKLYCDLYTGRTHQIRVHLSDAGHPLLGDQLYGCGRNSRKRPVLPNSFARQALHAWQLTVTHPATNALVSWHSEMPEDLAQLISMLRLLNVPDSKTEIIDCV